MFAFDSDSKFFLFFCCILELLFTFYYFSFLLLMSYSLCLLEPAIHRICHHLLAGLFSFCAMVPIFITFGGAPDFQARTKALYTFYFFYFS